MSASTPAALPALDNTMGCLFVGVMIAMGLWGAGSLQMYYYFNRYQKDDLSLKAFVVLVWILDTVHQGLISHSVYTYLITNFFNPEILETIVPSLLVEVIFSAFICLFVQCFLVFRVWRLSHGNYLLTGVLVSLVLSEFIVSMFYTFKGFPLKTFTRLPEIYSLSRAMNIISFVSDVGIAFSLIYLLNKSRTGFQRSETVINRLILFAVNTGLLTSLCAVMSLVTIQVLPNTFVYILFFLTISRLYTNTLFATLNARSSIRSAMPSYSNSLGDVSFSLGRFATAGTIGTFSDNSAKRKSMVVFDPTATTLSMKVNSMAMKDIDAEIPSFTPARPPSSSGSETNVNESAAASTYGENKQASFINM